MEISQFSSVLQAGGVSATNQVEGQRPPPPPPPPQDDELSDYFSQSAEDEEVKSFMQSIMDMEASGEFDAEAIAASAPASMQAYAEENGIDLTSFFAQKHEEHTARMEQNSSLPFAEDSETGAQAYQQTAQLGSPASLLTEKLTSSIQVNTFA